jgi:hypothetical protein
LKSGTIPIKMNSPAPQGSRRAATTLLTPRSGSSAVPLGGRRWSKQILPRGRVKVGGRFIDFDDRYFQNLIDAYRTGAFDAVPLQVSDQHTKDPKATEGALVDFRVTPQGLDGIIEFATDDGVELVRKNPKAGVSVSIVEDLARHVDGADRTWPAALQHVLMTTDPHVTGMGDWQQVELSTQVATLIDLSGSSYADVLEEPVMATETQTEESTQTEEGGDDTIAVRLPADQLARLQRLIEDDAAVERVLAEAGEEDEGETEQETDQEAAELSGDQGATIELMRSQLTEDRQTIQGLAFELNRAQVATELDSLRRTGLAPAVIEAARPLLELPRTSGTVELTRGDGSNDTVDPTELIRTVLRRVVELGRRDQLIVDLDAEDGLADQGSSAAQLRADRLKAWTDRSGS